MCLSCSLSNLTKLTLFCGKIIIINCVFVTLMRSYRILDNCLYSVGESAAMLSFHSAQCCFSICSLCSPKARGWAANDSAKPRTNCANTCIINININVNVQCRVFFLLFPSCFAEKRFGCGVARPEMELLRYFSTNNTFIFYFTARNKIALCHYDVNAELGKVQ